MSDSNVLEIQTALKTVSINWSLLREQALSHFDLQREEVAKEIEADMLLTVSDDNTRKAAKSRHWAWVKRRTALAAKKKDAGAEAKKIVALVADVADSFQSEFDKAEQHLAGEIDAYDAKIEAERKENLDALYRVKNDKLLAAGVTLDRLIVDSLTDEQIDQRCSEALELARLRKAEAERLAAEKAEADRLAAEQAEANKREAERLAAERKEFERQTAEQQAETDRLRKIEDDKLAARQAQLDEQQRAIDEANEKLRKAEAERIEEINRKRRDAEAAEAARQKEINDAQAKSEAEQRAAALRPDREKLLSVADILDQIVVPRVSQDDAADCARTQIIQALIDCALDVRKIVAEELK